MRVLQNAPSERTFLVLFLQKHNYSTFELEIVDARVQCQLKINELTQMRYARARSAAAAFSLISPAAETTFTFLQEGQ
jgi:hypothetical protein